MRKLNLTGAEYLERVLKWLAFIKSHKEIGTALRQALDELYDLRNKVQKDGAK